MGWDRPFQGFFMTVTRLDVEDRFEATLYDSDADSELAHAYPLSIDPFVQRLRALALQVPDTMLEQVRSDGRLNVGNRIVDYTIDEPQDPADPRPA